MAIDNKFRVSELVQSGSRAIISEDPISKTHTFMDSSRTIVSQSAIEPYEHLEGERDGELVNFIEKPKYDETQLKKAVDTIVDELILPPLPPSPDVVPKQLYDDLLARYNKAIADLALANNTIRELQARISALQGQIQSLLIQLDAAKVAQSIAENQAQQTNEKYSDLLTKFAQAIIKSTKEGIQRVSLNAQVEGLTAQKDTLREQITQLRQLVASLQGQVAAQLNILEIQTDAARAAQDAADNRLKDTEAAAEEAINDATKLKLETEIDVLGTNAYKLFPNRSIGMYIDTVQDNLRIAEPTKWDSDSGMIRWNADNKGGGHRNGTPSIGKTATLRIKSILGESATIKLTRVVITATGENASSGNQGVQNHTKFGGGPFPVGGSQSPLGKTWTIPAATPNENGVVEIAVQGPDITFGEAGDISKKTSGSSDAGVIGYYEFTHVQSGGTVKIPFSAIQMHADRY